MKNIILEVLAFMAGLPSHLYKGEKYLPVGATFKTIDINGKLYLKRIK